MTLALLFALAGCRGAPPDTAAPSIEVPCPSADAPSGLSVERFEPVDPARGGDLFTLVAAPSRPERLYTASYNNGLYRSDDAGASWTPLNSRITHMAGQVAVHPEDPDRLAYCADFLYLSDDAGWSWREPVLGGADGGGRVRGVAWLGASLFAVDQSGDLWRSDDDGSTFTWVLTVGRRHGGPGGWGRLDDWRALFAVEGQGLWVVEQQGGLWWVPGGEGPAQEVDGGPVSLGPAGLEDAGRLRYAVHGELRLAEPSGGWTSLGEAGHGDLQAGARLPDGAHLAWRDGEALRFDARGVTSEALPEDIVGVGAALVVDGGVLLAHAEGVAGSADGVEGWTDRSEGIVDRDLGVVLAHPVCEALVYVGTQCERGLYLSEDHGMGLEHLSVYAHYVMVLAANPARPTELWLTTDDQVMKSVNLGYAWEPVLPEDLRVHVHGLAIDPHDPARVLAGTVGSGEYADETGRVLITEDGGETWAGTTEGLPPTEASMHALSFLEDHPGVVLLGTYRGGDITHSQGEGVGLYRSEDGGWTWARVDLPTPTIAHVRDCPGGALAATASGVFRSTDAGQTWAPILPSEVEVLDVVCHGDRRVAIDDIGNLWRSEDGGDTWARWSQDPPLVPGGGAVANLSFSASGDIVYLAVSGHGLYRRRWPG